MATLAESTFIAAVNAAESARQTSRTNAFNTWAYGTGSALTTYISSLKTADKTYYDAVASAANTLGGTGISVPNAGASSQVPIVNSGMVGYTGPIPSQTATFGSTA